MSEAHRWLGIMDGRRVFNGPRIVQIDLTNNCDNSCIGCWIHSPLLGDARLTGEAKRRFLPFEKVMSLLDDFQRLRVEEVQLAGSGEPFMHPQIFDVLREIKKRGLRVEIVTDLTAPAAWDVEELVTIGVDFLTVSVWAGSAPTYVAVHPNKTEVTYSKLVGRLQRLAETKRQRGAEQPHVKIYQVINRLNAHEIEAMVDLAKTAEADFVEFQAMDLIAGKTDHLRLDREHREAVERQFQAVKGRSDYVQSFEYDKVPWDTGQHRKEAEEFGRLLYPVREGFRYDPATDRALCPAGRTSHPRIDGEPQVSEAHPLGFHFRTHPLRGPEHFIFQKKDCNGCVHFRECYQVPYGPYTPLRVPTLQVLGVGSFLRRIQEEDPQSSCHDASIVDSMPCYVGWIYSRVMTDGRVAPCCKGHNKPMGNIHEQNFSAIWTGERMEEFRQQAKSTSKGDPYFAPIQCRKSCDNVGMNLAMHQRITQMTKTERRTLRRLRHAMRSTGQGLKWRVLRSFLDRVWQRLRPGIVTVHLKDFVRGNLNWDEHEFGAGLVIDGGEHRCHAEYEVTLPNVGRYELWSRYASKEARPVGLFVDEQLVKPSSMGGVTGGLCRANLRWVKETDVELSAGQHTVRLFREGLVPHMERLVFRAVKGSTRRVRRPFLDRVWQRLRPGIVTVHLKDFVRGNLNGVVHEFGAGLVIDGGEHRCHAEYEVIFRQAGRYELWSRYASEEVRPVELIVDDQLVKPSSMAAVTGGLYRTNLRWVKETEVELSAGQHTVRLFREGLAPHMERLVFRAVNGTSQAGNGHAPDGAMLLGLRDRGGSYVGIVIDSLRRSGVRQTARKIIRNLSPQRLTKQYADLIGIYDGEHAYTGPNLVQIDVTNNCTNTCVGCWCHSPLLGEEHRMPIPVKRVSLPFPMVKDVLDQLTAMGTREIYYAGGGEPFMHPHMLDIAAHTKRNGLVCYINTAFFLVDEAKVNRMVELGIDHLTVSIWAGTPETYLATHPGKTSEDYFKIKRMLTLLNQRKREVPYVKVYHVISSRNYHELEPMVDFALETGSESVEFTVTDITPGGTEELLLTDAQRASVLEQCERIRRKMEQPEYAQRLILFRFDQFIQRVTNEHAREGEYDRGVIDATPCTIGWTFARVNADGDVNSCLKSHRFPLGNLYEHGFAEIWNNEKQRFFRRKTLEWNTDDPFFSLIGNDPKVKMGCYKSCDDIGRNLHTHGRMMALTPVERTVLQGVAKWRRVKRERQRHGR